MNAAIEVDVVAVEHDAPSGSYAEKFTAFVCVKHNDLILDFNLIVEFTETETTAKLVPANDLTNDNRCMLPVVNDLELIALIASHANDAFDKLLDS